MQVAAIQISAGDSKKKNLDKAEQFVLKAIHKGSRLICLPEVFNYRGIFQNTADRLAVGEKIPGESTSRFAAIAKKHRVHILCGSIYEKVAGQSKVYNTSVLISPSGKIAAKYRKINLFKAVFGKRKIAESLNFLGGTKKVMTSIDGFKTGLSVCYDLRFPDLYQHYAYQGADILCVPSAFTKKTGEAHWEILLRARAVENLCYVIAPNQTGKDGRGVATYGHSMIIDPWGKILARASGRKEEIIYADINQSTLKEKEKLLPGIAARYTIRKSK